MSDSEMNEAEGSSAEASTDWRWEERAASLRFAREPPPESTAFCAAWMRRSLRSEKSAGVRIYAIDVGLDDVDGENERALPS